MALFAAAAVDDGIVRCFHVRVRFLMFSVSTLESFSPGFTSGPPRMRRERKWRLALQSPLVHRRSKKVHLEPDDSDS